VNLWATDEVHFQQHGSRCRMWVPPETKDPVLLHHPTRRSVGYFGAVRLRDGKFRFSRGNGQIQRDDLLCLPEDVTPHEYPERPFRRGHYAQRQIPSCPASQKMARRP